MEANLTTFYPDIGLLADTTDTKVRVADTSRIIAMFWRQVASIEDEKPRLRMVARLILIPEDREPYYAVVKESVNTDKTSIEPRTVERVLDTMFTILKYTESGLRALIVRRAIERSEGHGGFRCY
jgi:hypothetical protein